MNTNLNFELNKLLGQIDKNLTNNMFLHSCCGPCSTAVLDRLENYFNIYIIFYNPNIDTLNEYNTRLTELKKYLSLTNSKSKIIYEYYCHNEFIDYIKGYENDFEGGHRCELCYELRLQHTFNLAKQFINDNDLENNNNYLCTTLSVSPHKNAIKIYNIGNKICYHSDIKYLPSDFKKENGYLNSIILSKKYNLYRQNYCGCEFSKMNIL